MPLEDIVQGIRFQGLGQSATELQDLGQAGAHAFDRIAEAAVKAQSGGLTAFGIGIAGIAVALATLTVRAANFVTEQAEMVLAMDALAQAAHTTTGAVIGLREGFAEVGINSHEVMRAIQMTTIRIASMHAQIQRDSRETSVTEESASQAIRSAHMRIDEASNHAAAASGQWADKLRSDAISVKEAWINLQYAAQEMSSRMASSFSSVQSASQSAASAALSVEQAELKLREKRTGTKDEQAEKALELKQAEQEVEKAKQAQMDAQRRQSDASMKASKEMQQAAIGPDKAQLSFDQAQVKQTEDLLNVNIALEKADLELERAITGLKQAVNRQIDVQLRDIDLISSRIRTGADTSDVAPNKLLEAITKMAEKDHEGEGWIGQFKEYSELFKSGKVSIEQQIQLMRETGFGGRMNTTATKAAEAFRTLDIDKLIAKGKEHEPSKDDIERDKDIVRAGAEFHGFIERAGRNFAAVLGEALKGMGLIHPATSGRAGGGLLSGPGSGTSDSIPIRASHGEYVVRSAAVQRYGVDLFDALNAMAVGGFSLGGPIGPTPIRTAEGGFAEGMAPLTLVLDGNKFAGLKAPAHVATKLKSYAVSQQYSRAGVDPSWNR